MTSRLAILALLSLLAAGCGDGDANPEASEAPAANAASEADAAPVTAPDRVSACDLLSSAEVADAFGTPFEEGRLEEHESGAESYLSICVFDAANEAARPSMSLSVRPDPGIVDVAAALRASVEDMRQNAMPDFELEPVPELGPGAGWSPALGQLHVFRPGFMITLGAMGAPSPRDRLLALARTALDRLPDGG